MQPDEPKHQSDCQWEKTTAAECEYRETHHYCPHPEHACTCKKEAEEEKPQPLICPHCEAPIHGLEIRPFGPGGIINMVGCKNCLKPLPVFLVAVETINGSGPAEQPKKSGIIT